MFSLLTICMSQTHTTVQYISKKQYKKYNTGREQRVYNVHCTMIVQTPVFAGPPHLVHIIIIKQPFFGTSVNVYFSLNVMIKVGICPKM